MNCCAFVSLKFKKCLIDLGNFELEIFVGVQGRFERGENMGKLKGKY